MARKRISRRVSGARKVGSGNSVKRGSNARVTPGVKRISGKRSLPKQRGSGGVVEAIDAERKKL